MQISCSAARPTEYPLSANSAYFFQRTPDETLTFREIDLQSDASTRSGRDLGNGAVWDVSAVIPVKLLVDDEEPAARKKWETRLRGRLEAAAEIFLERFRVRFEVVAVETWNSDSRITDFEESLSEFARGRSPPRPSGHRFHQPVPIAVEHQAFGRAPWALESAYFDSRMAAPGHGVGPA